MQVTLAMGDMAEQQHVFEAKANLKKTWEDMLKTVKGIDRVQPLEAKYDNNEPICHGLFDPTNPVVGLLTYIY